MVSSSFVSPGGENDGGSGDDFRLLLAAIPQLLHRSAGGRDDTP